MIRFVKLLGLIFLTINIGAQDIEFNPVVGFQIWSTLSEGTRFIDPATGNAQGVDGRWGFQLHRSRLGFKGKVGDRVTYKFIAASDFVGKDFLDGTIGGPNNTASPSFRLWDAFINYKLSLDSDLFHLKLGYIVPAISRESITSPIKVITTEKSWTQNYIRRHITNNGPGRTAGVNIGGFKIVKENTFAFGYDVGVYNSKLGDFNTNSAGRRASNLIAGRVTIHVGEPEMQNYLQGLQQLSFNKRRGVTVGLSQAYQGQTDFYDQNTLSAIDLLFQWDHFFLTGEWAYMGRSLNNVNADSNAAFARAGQILPLANGKHLSVGLTYMIYDGATDALGISRANQMRAFSGEDKYTEATVNYHLSPKSRLSLSHTWRTGSSGDIDPSEVNNNYYKQSGFTFMRPNYWVVAWHITI